MDSDFQNLLELFIELGGIAENICLRQGELGRGIFPENPLNRSRIITPRKLLVDCNDFYMSHDKIYIKQSNQLSPKEKSFVEMNYNYAWSGSGKDCAAAFLQYISTIPESLKNKLLTYGFINKTLLNCGTEESGVFARFICERFVDYEGKRVLASIWDYVNHSSFAPPFKVSSSGIKTPLIEPGPGEILHKYKENSSPMSMWKEYGFSCDCVVAYSIPFSIHTGDRSWTIRCSGRHGLGSKNKTELSRDRNIFSIKSLPIGSLSISLPKENFKLALSSIGLSVDLAARLFHKVRDINIKARHDLINSLEKPGAGTQAQLYKALMHEIELIESSLAD